MKWILASALSVSGVLLASSTSEAQDHFVRQLKVEPTTTGPICLNIKNFPHADREFSGNGPKIAYAIGLGLDRPNKIKASVYFAANETKPDHSGGEHGEFWDFASIPEGSRFTHVWAPVNGTWQWVEIGADRNPIVLGNVADLGPIYFEDKDHAPHVFLKPSWFVDSVTIVGDTKGDDLFAECRADKTSITVSFSAIHLRYESPHERP